MNSIKSDVKIYGIKPEMVLVDSIVQSIFNEHGLDCVRTSIVGKEHKSYSLHPPGYASDYRSKHIKTLSLKHQILDELKKALPCCDIVLEHIGKDQEHYHIEFDPKNDPVFQDKKAAYKRGEITDW